MLFPCVVAVVWFIVGANVAHLLPARRASGSIRRRHSETDSMPFACFRLFRLIPRLLGPQRVHRVDPRGATGRQVRRKQGDPEQHGRCNRVRDRIVRSNFVKE
jgi:hypothetical protein